MPVVIFLAGLDFESAPKGSDPPDIESFCSDSEKNGCMDEGWAPGASILDLRDTRFYIKKPLVMSTFELMYAPCI